MGSKTLHWHGVLIRYLTCPIQSRFPAKIQMFALSAHDCETQQPPPPGSSFLGGPGACSPGKFVLDFDSLNRATRRGIQSFNTMNRKEKRHTCPIPLDCSSKPAWALTLLQNILEYSEYEYTDESRILQNVAYFVAPSTYQFPHV